MMPHLGVLSQVHRQAAVEVFEQDCLIYLGTCVAAKGHGKPGKTCFDYQIDGHGLREEGKILVGEVRRFPLEPESHAQVTIQPRRGFDVGAGPGKTHTTTVHGGTVGLILDGRGRPLEILPGDSKSRELITQWTAALDMY